MNDDVELIWLWFKTGVAAGLSVFLIYLLLILAFIM